ncbi:MAG: hypothetical protein EHM38_01165 [Geobacteraceae bacterium]|nr:MAG: hypothetical protein EHM38_01165 [Geobacteraceae bacterium]
MKLYDRPKGEPLGKQIERGERIAVITGMLYVTPVKGVVTRSHGRLQQGEAIYMLDYVGEGTSNYLVKGRVVQGLEDYCSWNVCPNIIHFDGKYSMLPEDSSQTAPQQYWWKVQRRDGSQGWLSVYDAGPLYYYTDAEIIGSPPDIPDPFDYTTQDTKANDAIQPTPVIGVVASTTLDFGSVEIGQSAMLELLVENTGSGTLIGTCDTTPPFSTQGCVFDLAAGASKEISVSFSPKAAQSYVGSLFFSSNGGSAPQVLAGTGVSPVVIGGPLPEIRSITPESGLANDLVTIFGSNFGKEQGSSKVVFETSSKSADVDVIRWSDNKIAVSAPYGIYGKPLVKVITQAGVGVNYFVTFTLPEQIEFDLSQVYRPPVQERLDFYKGKLLKFTFSEPTSKAQEEAFLGFATGELNNNPDWLYVIDGRTREDRCYAGAMAGLKLAQGGKLITDNLSKLAGGIFGTSVGLITTGDVFKDIFINAVGEGVASVISNESVVKNVASSTAKKIGGPIMSKLLDDYFGQRLFTELWKFDVDTIKEFLEMEQVIAWPLSGDNFIAFDKHGSPLDRTSASARFYYNPWSHYSTAVFHATCEERKTGAIKERIYSVFYELEKGAGEIAIIKPGSVKRFLIWSSP